MAAYVVLRHSHKVAFIIKSSPIISPNDDCMDHNDVVNIAEEDDPTIVVKGQDVDQLRGEGCEINNCDG